MAAIVPTAMTIVLSAYLALLSAQGDEKRDALEKNGRALLEQALEKRGGMKALEVIKDYVVTMSGITRLGNGKDAKVKATRIVLLGEVPCLRYEAKVRLSESQDTVVRYTLKGEKGYEQNRFGGRVRSPHWVTQQWASYHRSSIAVLRALLDPKVKVEYVGKDRVRDRETEVIRVIRPKEPPLDVDVEPATGYFHRVRWRERPPNGAPPIPWEIRYGGFENLGHLKGVPTKAEVRVGGEVLMTRKTSSIKVNVGLKPEDFGVGEEEGRGEQGKTGSGDQRIKGSEDQRIKGLKD